MRLVSHNNNNIAKLKLSVTFCRTVVYFHPVLTVHQTVNSIRNKIHFFFNICVVIFAVVIRIYNVDFHSSSCGCSSSIHRIIRAVIQHGVFIVFNSTQLFLHNLHEYIIYAVQNFFSASKIFKHVYSLFFCSLFKRICVIFLGKNIRICQSEAINTLFYVSDHKSVSFSRNKR